MTCCLAQGGVFAETSLAAELNAVLEPLIAAHVTTIAVTCLGSQCSAVVSMTAPSPLNIRVTQPGKEATYLACDAQFGRVLASDQAVVGVLGLSTPLSACGPVTLSVFTTVGDGEEAAPIIALAGRGECSFAEKARFAQAAGAVGILVVDFHNVFPTDTNAMRPQYFSLADDGTGSNLTVFAGGMAGMTGPVEVEAGPPAPFLCAIGLRRMDCEGDTCDCHHILPYAQAVLALRAAHSLAADPVSITVSGTADVTSEQTSTAVTNAAVNAVSAAMGRVMKG